MYNNPSGNTGQISIGPGRIYIGAAGATPSTDMGYVKGSMTINLEREAVEIRQGSPQIIVEQLVSREDAMIEFTGIQWNLDNVLLMLGDGATSASDPDDILKVGGRPASNAKAIRFEHRMADGGTLVFDIWKAKPEGVQQITINEGDVHELPYKFKAMYPGTTDWGGASLSAGQELFRIIRTKP